jgi:hypothetical protein
MIWDCITIYSARSILRKPKHLYQYLYKLILVGALPGTTVTYGIVVKDVTLQHNNNPKHTSKTVKEWLS